MPGFVTSSTVLRAISISCKRMRSQVDDDHAVLKLPHLRALITQVGRDAEVTPATADAVVLLLLLSFCLPMRLSAQS